MSSKRKRQDGELAVAVHPSRQFQVPGNNSNLAKKPRRFEAPVHKKQAHASSVNAVKKKIRDTRRRLERAVDLPADVRVEDERALAAYEQDLAEAEAEGVKQKMIKRYHMVRFFERQKATRQAKKTRKRLLEAKSTEEAEEMKKQMHIAEVDLNYTQYSPLSEVYISIYPQKTSLDETESSEKPDEPSKPTMWFEVEKCMEEGTLERLRNRVAEVPLPPSRPLEIRNKRPAQSARAKAQSASVDLSGLNRRERRSQRGAQEGGRTKGKSMAFAKNEAFGASQAVQRGSAEDAEEEDSDGGFFEDED